MTIESIAIAKDTQGRTLLYVTTLRHNGTKPLTEYRTDTAGEGLWEWRALDWKQIMGTMQFSANATPRTVRKRIRDILEGTL